MSTFVDDMRVALAEIAPHLADLIHAPTYSWSNWKAPKNISYDDFVLIRRASRLTCARHGRQLSACDPCAWAAFRSVDDAAAGARLHSDGCPHNGHQP